MIHFFQQTPLPTTAFLQDNELLPSILFHEDYLNKHYPWLKLQQLHAKHHELYYPSVYYFHILII